MKVIINDIEYKPAPHSSHPFLSDTIEAIASLSRHDIDVLCDAVGAANETGGRIFVCGNGGDASIASHWALDMTKNAGIPVICLNDSIAAITAYSNDTDYDNYLCAIAHGMNIKSGDVCVMLSTSGGSGNIINLGRMCARLGVESFLLSSSLDHVSHTHGILIDSDIIECIEDAQAAVLHAVVRMFKHWHNINLQYRISKTIDKKYPPDYDELIF